MAERNLFDHLKDKARTEDEWEAIDIGMSVGIHAAIEHFLGDETPGTGDGA